MEIPGDDAIRALHRKYAPTPAAFTLVHDHCVIVAEIAGALAARTTPCLDAALVRAGSLLHDIGVYRLFGADGRIDHATYIRHGLLGHDLLAAEGFSEELCRFCSRHTGVGLTADDIREQGLPLPPADYRAETDEELLVMYADKFHSRTDPPVFLTAESYAAKVRIFGAEKESIFAGMCDHFGDPDPSELAELAAAYGHPIV